MKPEDNRPDGGFKFYGRRKGMPLSDRQSDLIENYLPTIAIDPKNPLADIDKDKEIWLETGFGGGEHLIHQAINNPEKQFIGIEPFVNGVAKYLSSAYEHKLTNVRIYDGDARVLLPNLPDQCLSRLFLLYPDPWHKTRHNKRRFVNTDTTGHFHRLIKPGGVFRFASDIDDYVKWTVKNINAHGGFSYEGDCADDWRQAPTDWCETRYEQKAKREGRTPNYIAFHRV